MTIVNRIVAGIYMAAQSFFMLLSSEKKLLLYLGIPALFSFAAKLLIYNIFTISMDSPNELLNFTDKFIASILTNNEWKLFAIVSCIHLMTTLITVFFHIALVHHLGHIIQGDTSTAYEAIKTSFNKKKNIVFWTLVTVIVEIVWKSAESTTSFVSPLLAATLTLFVLGSLFVLPLIGLTNRSLWSIAKESVNITKKSLPEIAGGSIWFGLVIVLMLMPLIIAWAFTSAAILEHMLKNPALYPMTLFASVFLIEILIRCVVSTAYTIFKVIIYQHYQKTSANLQ